MNSGGARPYRMGVRANKTAENRDRIMDAAVAMFWDRPSDGIPLDAVADRAGVSVRSVIRYFGGKDGLVSAAVARELQRTRDERDEAPAGDLRAAVTILVSHYERIGDRVLVLLAEEQRHADLGQIVERGRQLHRDWCTRVFAEALVGLSGVERQRRIAQLVAVCDVYTWHLLRRDCGLSRRQAELALVELLSPLTRGNA